MAKSGFYFSLNVVLYYPAVSTTPCPTPLPACSPTSSSSLRPHVCFPSSLCKSCCSCPEYVDPFSLTSFLVLIWVSSSSCALSSPPRGTCITEFIRVGTGLVCPFQGIVNSLRSKTSSYCLSTRLLAQSLYQEMLVKYI